MPSTSQSRLAIGFYEPYPMGLGGNFRTQRLILERLPPEKFKPIVIAPMEGVALDRFRTMGVECVVVPPPGQLARYGGTLLRSGWPARLKSAWDLFRYNLQLARFFRERGMALIYANCVRAQMSVGLAARLAGVPSLLYVKGELANPVIDRLSLLLASRVLFFSAQNRDDRYPRLIHRCRRKIGLLRIGLDLAPIDGVLSRDHVELRKELEIDPCALNTAVLGQLYRPKGQHVAIEALARLAEEFPQAQLYLVGDQVLEEYRPYTVELKALAERLGLAQRVHFTGWRRDALEIGATMDIILHPSMAEGFGRAVLEAMALGKPVVASAVGGLREAIQDGGNGFLTPPGDVEAVVVRWRSLLASRELRMRMGAEARRTVLADYLIDDKVRRLGEIWEEMAAVPN